MCGPSGSGPKLSPEWHGAKLPGTSIEHSKPAASGLGELKLKLGRLSAVGPLGPPVIWVVGGTVSTTKERWSGVGSVFPEPSRASTAKL